MHRIFTSFGVGRLTTLTALTLLGGACASANSTGAGDAPGDGTALVNVSSSLVQSVSVTPADPASGTNIEVRSILVNRGSSAVQLESRICGLDFAGTLTLTHPPEVMKCAGYSGSSTLAPGDSVVGGDLMRVASPAGTYTLRIKHALQPSAWAELQVQVR